MVAGGCRRRARAARRGSARGRQQRRIRTFSTAGSPRPDRRRPLAAISGATSGVASGSADTERRSRCQPRRRAVRRCPGQPLRRRPRTTATAVRPSPTTTATAAASAVLPTHRVAATGSAAGLPGRSARRGRQLPARPRRGHHRSGTHRSRHPPLPRMPLAAAGTAAAAAAPAAPADVVNRCRAATRGPGGAPARRATLQPQLAKPLFTLVGAPQGQHIMTLKVSPEDLGPLTVRAHIDAAGVRIELFAPGDAGREAVRGILPELRKELARRRIRRQPRPLRSQRPRRHRPTRGPGRHRARTAPAPAASSPRPGPRRNGSGPGSRNGPGRAAPRTPLGRPGR